MKPEFRPVDAAIAGATTPPASLGPVPELRWILISDLVIDETYQRDIRRNGQRQVRRIAERFSWTKFAPVVVAPVSNSGWYCIVDGQHRTSAAAAIGIKQVPCLIIDVDTVGAAESFAAINGEVTKVSSLEKFKARIAAGEPEALALQEVLTITEVELCRYPIPAWDMTPGQTLALGALEFGMGHGRDTLITALQCITQTENNVVGILRAPVIRALVRVLSAYPVWRDAGEALLKAFDEIDMMELYERAVNSRVAATADELVALLKQTLTRKLGPPLEIGRSA